jgi:hypothetical protein
MPDISNSVDFVLDGFERTLWIKYMMITAGFEVQLLGAHDASIAIALIRESSAAG